MQRSIFEWVLQISDFDIVSTMPSIQQPGQVLLSGLLIMADWIASNEKYFPLVSLEITEIDNQQARMENGFSKWLEDAS